MLNGNVFPFWFLQHGSKAASLAMHLLSSMLKLSPTWPRMITHKKTADVGSMVVWLAHH